MALRGINVIELAGLAPAPFCGMLLSDFGAKVIRIDRVGTKFSNDSLARGKRSVMLNLKAEEGTSILHRLCLSSDVLIEPFRPGVMEKMNFGPERLLKDNPRLIYARLTGYGQDGCNSKKAGHDINYIATSGVLSTLGRPGEKPNAPINLVADFAGGGLMCAFGILAALIERAKSGKGQVVDTSMTEGSAYVSSFLWKSRNIPMPLWGKPRGCNMLDGGAPFYDTYETSDGKYMAVGALEPQFYSNLLKGLDLSEDEAFQFEDPTVLRKLFTEKFLSKTQKEWTQIFENLDACVTPVIELSEAHAHPHNCDRKAFVKSSDGNYEPSPAPVLSRTPGIVSKTEPILGGDTQSVLLENGYSDSEIESFIKNGIVEVMNKSKL